MKVLYEDNHLLIIEKPFNMPSQKDSSEDPDVLTMGKAYLKEKYNKPGNVYLGLVSRLDRPCGGVMLLAKTSKAAKRMNEQFSLHSIKKEYLAIIDAVGLKEEDTFEDYLLKDSRANTVKVDPKGKYSLLSYRKIAERNNRTLVLIDLKTGRPHQIRVQFSSRNYPLTGDQRYNSKAKKEQLALWSFRLTFTHPVTKKEITICDFPGSVFNEFDKEIKEL